METVYLIQDNLLSPQLSKVLKPPTNPFHLLALSFFVGCIFLVMLSTIFLVQHLALPQPGLRPPIICKYCRGVISPRPLFPQFSESWRWAPNYGWPAGACLSAGRHSDWPKPHRKQPRVFLGNCPHWAAELAESRAKAKNSAGRANARLGKQG